MLLSRRAVIAGAASTTLGDFAPETMGALADLPSARTAADQTGLLPGAAASDPVALGWMHGTPPPRDKQIRFEDGSFLRFPQQRWTFSHWRQLRPTARIARAGPIVPLPRAIRHDLDAVSFIPIGAIRPMSWEQSLAANYTDGIVILHDGRIVYERYFGALAPDGEHIAFSVGKSLVGTIAAMLITEEKLGASDRVSSRIPELAASGFGDATVQQVLDMTTALAFKEDYVATSGDFAAYRLARGTLPLPAGYQGAASAFEFAQGIRKNGEHGRSFVYRTPNTDVLAWLISRAERKPLHEVISDRIWGPLGAEADACIHVDPSGAGHAGAGFNCRLRDLARFGEMMRLGGQLNGRQIVPRAVVDEIRQGGDQAKFGGYTTLSRWSYGSHWWHAHDKHGVLMARGTFGQALYIDPEARLVIARFASHPMAANVNLDPTSLPAYRAIAEHLMSNA